MGPFLVLTMLIHLIWGDEWKNWRVDDPRHDRGVKKKWNVRGYNGWQGMAGVKADGRDGWRDRITDERPSRDVDLDETGWDWFKGLGLWDSVTGHDARSCGVGLGWGLVGRCCPVPGTKTTRRGLLIRLTGRRVKLVALSAVG